MAEEQIKTGFRLVCIGGSSGSLEALSQLLPVLDNRFRLPVLIVLHRSNAMDNGLTTLLASRTSLTIKEAEEKELLQPGSIYLAPPDYHVLLEEDGTLSLDVSEKVHFSRPSIEVSFSSAAHSYKKGLVAVLLSGANADGAAAMIEVKNFGGVTIVQDPQEALVDFMPLRAIQLAPVDYILRAADIVALLNGFSANGS